VEDERGRDHCGRPDRDVGQSAFIGAAPPLPNDPNTACWERDAGVACYALEGSCERIAVVNQCVFVDQHRPITQAQRHVAHVQSWYVAGQPNLDHDGGVEALLRGQRKRADQPDLLLDSGRKRNIPGALSGRDTTQHLGDNRQWHSVVERLADDMLPQLGRLYIPDHTRARRDTARQQFLARQTGVNPKIVPGQLVRLRQYQRRYVASDCGQYTGDQARAGEYLNTLPNSEPVTQAGLALPTLPIRQPKEAGRINRSDEVA